MWASHLRWEPSECTRGRFEMQMAQADQLSPVWSTLSETSLFKRRIVLRIGRQGQLPMIALLWLSASENKVFILCRGRSLLSLISPMRPPPPPTLSEPLVLIWNGCWKVYHHYCQWGAAQRPYLLAGSCRTASFGFCFVCLARISLVCLPGWISCPHPTMGEKKHSSLHGDGCQYVPEMLGLIKQVIHFWIKSIKF